MGCTHHCGQRDQECRHRRYQFAPASILFPIVMMGLLAIGCQRHSPQSGATAKLQVPSNAAPAAQTDFAKPLADFNQGTACSSNTSTPRPRQGSNRS